MRAVLVCAFLGLGLFPLRADQGSMYRANFKKNYPGGELAVVDATSIGKAQSASKVLYSPQGCISLSKRKHVFIYANHFFGDEKVGDQGFFVLRITAATGSAAQKIAVHAYRNDGWIGLTSTSELDAFEIRRGQDPSFEELQELHTRLFNSNGSEELAEAVNRVLAGKFHARTKDGKISSALNAGLFKEAPKPAEKIWHYLISFQATSTTAGQVGKRPIISFDPLGGVDTYIVEAVANSEFASPWQTLTVKIGAQCS